MSSGNNSHGLYFSCVNLLCTRRICISKNSPYLWFVHFITKLLALYFVALLFLPCGDADAGTASNNNFNQHQNGEPEDECPPLCFCVCCTTVADATEPIIITQPPHFSRNTWSIYNLQQTKSILIAIWQPPKLG